MATELEKQVQEHMGWTFMYFHNVSPAEIVRVTYGEPKDSATDSPRVAYLAGKVSELERRGPSYFYGNLDLENRRRLSAAIVARYAEKPKPPEFLPETDAGQR